MPFSSFLMQAIPLVMVFFVFYVVVMRPGRVSEGRRWAEVKAIVPGDRVVLYSGMLGGFVALHGHVETGEYEIEIADGVRVRVLETAIKSVVKQVVPVAPVVADVPPSDDAIPA